MSTAVELEPIAPDPDPLPMQAIVRGAVNPLGIIVTELQHAVFGQDRAIESVVRALNRGRYGFAAGTQSRPVVNLLFLGPTGVGKSECAKRLARLLHPEGDGFLKIDCSLFSQGHEVSALVGAAPGYIGREQKPLFDPDVLAQENNVLLLDEIEKGSPELWDLLLHIMEDGEITLLNSGKTVSFRNTVLIMTTNVGAKEMLNFINKRNLGFKSTRQDMEATAQQIYQIGLDALHKFFRPEWINRIDEIIAFRPLSSASMSRIFDRMIAEANDQYRKHGIQVAMSLAAKEFLLRRGYHPASGARPLRASLLKYVDAPIADLLASESIPVGSRVLVVYTGNDQFGEELAFFYQQDKALALQARELYATANHKEQQQAAQQETSEVPSFEGPAIEKAMPVTPRNR